MKTRMIRFLTLLWNRSVYIFCRNKSISYLFHINSTIAVLTMIIFKKNLEKRFWRNVILRTAVQCQSSALLKMASPQMVVHILPKQI